MSNRIYQTKAKLIKSIAVRPKYYKIWLEAAGLAKAARPGQFIQVKVNAGSGGAFLRRPFSIHRAGDRNIVIVFEVVGRATEILAEKRPGGCLDIIGPLGNGFDYGLRVAGYGLRVLVAGGMGVAPLIFLAEKLTESKIQSLKPKVLVLLGAKTKNDILCEKEFKQLGCEVKIATDDGSKGFRGYVSELLKHTLSTMDCEPLTIYGCGPRPMLKEISNISEKYNKSAQISLEEHMACGIGACLGCVINTTNGYRSICKQGPVFQANQIIWGKE